MNYQAEWNQWMARYQQRTQSAETRYAFQDQTLHHQFREARRAAYRLRVAQYILGMLSLAILNFIISPHYPWVLVPLLGATIGIVVEGLAVYQNVGEQYEQDFSRWLTRRTRQSPL